MSRSILFLFELTYFWCPRWVINACRWCTPTFCRVLLPQARTVQAVVEFVGAVSLSGTDLMQVSLGWTCLDLFLNAAQLPEDPSGESAPTSKTSLFVGTPRSLLSMALDTGSASVICVLMNPHVIRKRLETLQWKESCVSETPSLSPCRRNLHPEQLTSCFWLNDGVPSHCAPVSQKEHALLETL